MSYKPSIGETVFVSLSGNIPLLITITGFRHHSYLNEEVMEFQRLDGSRNWGTYRNQHFFPEIPVDRRYLYVVSELTDNGYDGLEWTGEEHWFFTADEAFEFQPDEDWIVEVRKVT